MRTALKFVDGAGPAPNRLLAEAVRLRLEQLVIHGCWRGGQPDKLKQAVKDLEPKPALLADLWLALRARELVLAGSGDWVALYRVVRNASPNAATPSSAPAVEMLMVVTHDGTTMQRMLLLLDAEVFWPPAAPEPMLAVSSTHPWMSSCWRHMRFRVFRPGRHAHHPVPVLVRDPLGGRYCSGTKIVATGSDLTLRYEDWKGWLSPAAVERPYVVAFRYDPVDHKLRERFGFAPGIGSDFPGAVFAHLVEDWLRRDWRLASEATTPGAKTQLESVHRRLSARKKEDAGHFTFEVYPDGKYGRRLTVFCVVEDPPPGAPCPAWPVPVDFHLRQQDGLWRVKRVRPWASRSARE